MKLSNPLSFRAIRALIASQSMFETFWKFTETFLEHWRSLWVFRCFLVQSELFLYFLWHLFSIAKMLCVSQSTFNFCTFAKHKDTPAICVSVINKKRKQNTTYNLYDECASIFCLCLTKNIAEFFNFYEVFIPTYLWKIYNYSTIIRFIIERTWVEITLHTFWMPERCCCPSA